jgi:hypothetical protein
MAVVGAYDAKMIDRLLERVAERKRMDAAMEG